MDDVGRLWTGVILCVVIIALMGFFTACENAAVEFVDSRLKKQAEDGDKRAIRLSVLLERPSRLVASNIISRSVMIIIMSVVGTIYFFAPLTDSFVNMAGIKKENVFQYYLLSVASFLIIAILLTVVISVFGINIPKKLCISGKLGEKFILRSSVLYKGWIMLFKPLEIADDMLARGILSLFGVRKVNAEENVTEEEILMMVDAVNETGGIEDSQAEMISNIFDFDDTEVREVMTHRTEIEGIEENEDVKNAVKLVIDEGFSRIPVYEENVDNITGVIFAKDLLKLVFDGDEQNHAVKEYMREIRYVPESNKCGELFNEFTKQKTQIAVVVDEYGGTAGIITMEDLLETIVGSIQDEYDDEDEEIQEITPNTYDFLGKADYSEAMEALGVEVEDDTEYDTVGGFIIDLLGHIPGNDDNAVVEWNNIEFTVISVDDNKIEKIRAVKKKTDNDIQTKEE